MKNTEQLFSLTLSPPVHGWLPIHLQVADFILECCASKVLNDPIRELLGILGFTISPNQIGRRACLWTEPAGYVLEVALSDAQGQFLLRVLFDEYIFPPMENKEMTLLFEGKFEARTFSRSLLKSFHQFFDSCDAANLERWNANQNYFERFAALRTEYRAKIKGR
jgi:hypothetical protein